MKFKAGERVFNARRSWGDPTPATVVKATEKQVVIQEDPGDYSTRGMKWTLRGDDIDHLFHTQPEAYEYLAQKEERDAARYDESASQCRENAAEFRRKAREPKTN